MSESGKHETAIKDDMEGLTSFDQAEQTESPMKTHRLKTTN